MTDEDRTEELGAGEPDATAPTEQRPEAETGRPRRLFRSRSDRIVAGVAGGLGEYFAVDPLIVRIGFAISIFFGGLGALAYIALVLFVPEPPVGDGEEERPLVERSRWMVLAVGVIGAIAAISALGSLVFWDDDWGWGGGPWGLLWLFVLGAVAYLIYTRIRDRETPMRGGRLLAAVVLAVFAIAALCVLALASAFAGATGNGVVVAVTLIAIGLLLVLAAFRGGARWLIAPALALAVPLAIVSAADISFGDGIGEREYRPATMASIPDEGYELGVGRLVIDLRDLPWRERTVADLDVDLGIGEAIVAVPEDVCVSAHATMTAGELYVAGDRNDGINVETDGIGPTAATPRLELDAEVDVGALRVINDDETDVDDHFDRWDHDALSDEEHTELARQACAR
jgi:phage shock protein PspC (stress-responsive transcriptional regulator)